MKLLANACVVLAALGIVVTATGQEEKTEKRRALTVFLFDADTKGISKGIKQIEIPEEKVAKKVRLADAVGKPIQVEWPQLKLQLRGTEITDPKREWVVKSVKMTLADDKVVDCQVLSLRDTGKTTIKLSGPPESDLLIRVSGLGKLTSDKGKRTWYVYLAEYWETVVQAKDPPKNFTNSIGMKFVWIPPGTFMMGSSKKEIQIKSEPQHKVKLTKGFYLGVFTVTQEEWQSVMGNNPSAFKGEKNLPVETVSWNDCQEFIKKLREKDKKPYRLPTEAEWEYACRAGTTTPFHFGETISTDQANYDGNGTYGNGKKGVYRKKTTPVGSFPANAWGLHDMHGNVCQWCQDWFGDYPQKDVVDPQGPDAGTERVQRGGSWHFNPGGCRSAFRWRFEPGHLDYGLRVCFCVD